MDLPAELKEAATKAFRDNAKLTLMSLQARDQAARWYEQTAAHMVGTQAELARRYNLERARFLRGEVSHIAPTALLFDAEME